MEVVEEGRVEKPVFDFASDEEFVAEEVFVYQEVRQLGEGTEG